MKSGRDPYGHLRSREANFYPGEHLSPARPHSGLGDFRADAFNFEEEFRQNISMATANPSKMIDEYIADLTDWRGKVLTNLRKVIHAADPAIIEEWKWMGSPCWSHDGLICVANAHKEKVKVTFAQGASLEDPDKVFNAGLDGNRWRAIDLYEGDKVNERGLKNLIRSAVAFNGIKPKKTMAGARAAGPKAHKK